MNTVFDNGYVQLMHADAMYALREMDVESVDCIISDPPYNVGMIYGDNNRIYDKRPNYREWLWAIWRECGRVAKEGSFLIFTNTQAFVQFAFEPPVPWKFFHLSIWHKPLSLSPVFYGIGMHWEPIIMWVKGKPWRPFRGDDVSSDVFVANVVCGPRRNGLRLHPTVKPLVLNEMLINFACPEEGTILDPFVGTGTTLIAAVRTGHKAIGIEVNDDFCRLAIKRFNTESIKPLALTRNRCETVPIPMPLEI